MEISSSYPQTFRGYKSSFSKKLEKSLAAQRTTSQSASRLLNDFAEMYDKKVCIDKKIGYSVAGKPIHRIKSIIKKLVCTETNLFNL